MWWGDKREVLALLRVRSSQGAPERRILGAAVSDKDASGGLESSEGYRHLTAAWHGVLLSRPRAMTDDNCLIAS